MDNKSWSKICQDIKSRSTESNDTDITSIEHELGCQLFMTTSFSEMQDALNSLDETALVDITSSVLNIMRPEQLMSKPVDILQGRTNFPGLDLLYQKDVLTPRQDVQYRSLVRRMLFNFVRTQHPRASVQTIHQEVLKFMPMYWRNGDFALDEELLEGLEDSIYKI